MPFTQNEVLLAVPAGALFTGEGMADFAGVALRVSTMLSGLAVSPFWKQFLGMQAPASKQHRPRRSACADASLRAEIERVDRMTIEERVKAALSMGQRFSWVKDVAEQVAEETGSTRAPRVVEGAPPSI